MPMIISLAIEIRKQETMYCQKTGMMIMTDEERKDKIRELQRRNKKSPEFLERMQYIRELDFSVRTTDEEPGFVVVVTEKTLSEKRTTNGE